MDAEVIDPRDMAAVKLRLNQIAQTVSDDDLTLDEALAYYEEAVKLGMKASALIEEQIAGTAEAGADPAASQEG